MLAAAVSILGAVFFAIVGLRVALCVRSRREAERKNVAEYLDHENIGATAGLESPESQRPSQVPGPTAWKQ